MSPLITLAGAPWVSRMENRPNLTITLAMVIELGSQRIKAQRAEQKEKQYRELSESPGGNLNSHQHSCLRHQEEKHPKTWRWGSLLGSQTRLGDCSCQQDWETSQCPDHDEEDVGVLVPQGGDIQGLDQALF